MARLNAAPEPTRPAHLRTERVRLADGAATTVHVAVYDLERTAVRVVRLRRAQPLAAWCARHGVAEAIVGGFFLRHGGEAATPLGELRTAGVRRRTVPFDAPWDAVRGCLHVGAGRVALERRDALRAMPRGDLLQAGPLLLDDGVPCVAGDPEGFSAGARQFDSDITEGRHPRAAIGLTSDGRLLAVACDGRAPGDAGLTLEELADVLAARGAVRALNLDGGGSTSLVCAGVLRNVPRESEGAVVPGGRALSTAVTFTAR